MKNILTKSPLLAICLIVSACSNLPPMIENPPAIDLSYEQILVDPARFQNQPVRWGGIIVEVENEENLTNLQILFYPLDRNGRPKTSEQNVGRFIAQSPKFLDPAVYKKETEITVAGLVIGDSQRKIGNKTLKLPVISIQTDYLWPKQVNRDCRYSYPYSMGFYPYGYSGWFGYPYFYSPCY